MTNWSTVSGAVTYTYDKLEYCVWGGSGAEDKASWDLGQVTEEIINDLEGAVPGKLRHD